MYTVDAVATYIKALQIIYPTKEFRINLIGGQSDNANAKGGSANGKLLNKSLAFILVCTILIFI